MNDNKQYTFEELVDNSNFISWVQNGQEASSFWTEFGQDDKAQLAIKQEAIELIELLQFSEDESVIQHHKEKVWAGIEDKTAVKATIEKTKKSNIRPLYWIGTAAAACLLILLMFKQGDTENSIMNIRAHDEIVHHTLPDQSSIEITPGSSISYDNQSWEKNREVTLDGEAFFSVEKGQSFTVKNENATVVVLGTRFNVKSTERTTEVICLTGKVKVMSNQSSKQEIITANQSATVDNSEVSKQIHSKIYIPWKEDEFSFSDVSLKDVFDEIERSFNVNISLDSKYMDQQFNGSVEKSSLEDVLHAICWPMKLKPQIDGTQVTITAME